MKMLRFEVRGQYITRIDEEVPVAKCMNVFKAHFDFLTEEWTGTKTAIFVQGNYSKSQVLDEKGECIVPWEFFDTEEKTRGYVSVYCGDLMTANESKVMIAKTGYRESDASVPPTPDVYHQILESMDGKLDKAGHVPNKYLGTDNEGNIVEKEEPSGGGSGTTDYNDLENKPHINGVELQGEKTLEELGIQKKGNYASKEEIPTSLPASDVYDWAKEPEKPLYTADEVGAEEKGTIDKHNVSKETHQDIREILTRLEEKVKAIANSDDESLDTLAEIVAYIKSNKSLIDAITTGKVSTSDIVNDLITNVETKVLSAAQGVELKRQIDEVVKSIPKKLPNPHKLTFTGTVKAEYDGSGAVTVEIPDSSEGINAKLDKNQGAENAGKALVIGEDGNVVPGEVQGGGDGIAIINTMSSVSPLAIPDSAERPIKGFNIIGNTVQNQEPPPSPDHPQEIKSVGKWNETKQKYEVDVKITGKNLFDMNKFIDTCNFTKNEDGTFRIDKFVRRYDCFIPTNTILSIEVLKVADSSGAAVLELFYEDGKNMYVGFSQVGVKTFLIQKDVAYIKVLAYRNHEYKYIQLEKGTTATPYEPYKEQTLTLTSDRPITKWDKLVEQDGQIGWLYQSAIKTFKDDVFKLYSDNEKAIQYQIPFEEITGSWEESVCYCNTFENVKGNLIYTQLAGKDFYMGCMQKAMVFSAKTKQGIFASLEAFQQWIRNSDTYVLHKTNTTEFVPLQQSEQDAIRALKTYYPTTVITVDGGEVYGGVEVTYTADTKNYIDNKIKQEKSTPTAIPEIS